MKTKLLLVVFLLTSVFSFGQLLTRDNVVVRQKLTTVNAVVGKTLGYDDIQGNTITTVVGDTAALYINWKLGNIQSLALTDTAEVTMTAPFWVADLTLIITHANNTTNFPLYFNSPTVKWVGGTAYTPTNTAYAVDIIHLIYNGTYYYAFFDKDYK